MTDKNKIREFWLIENPIMKGNFIVNYDSQDRPPTKYWDQHIHVIEKSAYDELQKQAEVLVEALKDIEKAYPTSGERMAHQDYARKTLAAWEKFKGEK